MGLVYDLLPVINTFMMIGFPYLIVFDRHDPEEKKYIKIIFFMLSCLTIFEAYRYSKLGVLLDDLLDSNIFTTTSRPPQVFTATKPGGISVEDWNNLTPEQQENFNLLDWLASQRPPTPPPQSPPTPPPQSPDQKPPCPTCPDEPQPPQQPSGSITLKLSLEHVDPMPTHPGAILFNEVIPNPIQTFSESIKKVVGILYDSTSEFFPDDVNRIKVTINEEAGVAHVIGHNMWISVNHIQNSYNGDKNKLKYEIEGVLAHEFTHIWQYSRQKDNLNSIAAPGGLIEGIADFVRLKAGYGASHWRKKFERWDAGYDSTAFFLEYIENSHPEFVSKLNQSIAKNGWEEKSFSDITGKSLSVWWNEYVTNNR